MASGKSKEELAKIGAKTRFKAGKKQAEIARQGAIASTIAKREKRTMREIAEIILSKDVMTSDGVVTGKYAMLAEVIKKALKGDLQAATFIRDTIGEKPTDKQEITGSLGVKKVFVTKEDQAAVEEHIADVIGDGR